MKTLRNQKRRLTAFTILLLTQTVLLVSIAGAGDSIYGRVTAVKRADLITLDYGAGSYEIRIAGIEIPKDGAALDEATLFTSKLLLNKPARMRFDGRNAEGEMIGRIYTDDPEIGIKDVGIEMVRAGVAMPERAYQGYKYGQFSQALKEARTKELGIWKGKGNSESMREH